MSYHLIDVIQQLGKQHILVIGDLILDRYIWADAERISQEAPVILLREDHQEARPGGAANVANMLRGLDVDVSVAGVVGCDADADVVRQQLLDAGVNIGALLTDPDRVTTTKQRFMGRAQHRHPHQILRVDRETRSPLCGELTEQLISEVRNRLGEFDTILVSDYAKGVCHPELITKLISAATDANVPVIVDPPSTVSWDHYAGATAVTPNRLESSRATDLTIDCDATAFAAGRILCDRLKLQHAFITLDSDGIALVTADGQETCFTTRRRQVYDITGAGDMVLATIGAGTAGGAAPSDMAQLANIAGGLEVEQIGVVTISRGDMIADLLDGRRSPNEKICSLDEVARHVAARRSLGQRIVLTNGCFDVLHTGHIVCLQQAAAEGDCLVVAINSDSSVRQIGKAPDRPIFDERHRATILAAMEGIDYVLTFDELTPHNVINRLKPDLLVKGGTYSEEEIVGHEIVTSYGGEVRAMGVVPGISTTELLRRIRGDSAPATIPYPATPPPQRKAG